VFQVTEPVRRCRSFELATLSGLKDFCPIVISMFGLRGCLSSQRQDQPDNCSFRWQRKQRCNTPQVFGAYCKNGPGSVQTNASRAVESNQENYCTVSCVCSSSAAIHETAEKIGEEVEPLRCAGLALTRRSRRAGRANWMRRRRRHRRATAEELHRHGDWNIRFVDPLHQRHPDCSVKENKHAQEASST
jgi:hypothetical protein